MDSSDKEQTKQHDTSRVVARLAALPLVCMASFLFYKFLGSGIGSNENSKPLLRLRGDNRNANRSNVADVVLESIDDSIPDCARNVFVTLHKEEGGEGEHACRGLIIRDDIIVTSKECSTFNFTLDFAGVGIVEANPHPALSEGKEMAMSSLGFLEAHPPYHFLFINRPVRRTQLFLSKKSNPRVNGTEDPAVVLTCGERGQPIAHNFPAHGEMVPLLELEGIVPDDVLWEDKDLQTAKKLSHRPHYWWTRPITLEEEEQTIRDMIEEYTGPPGSISIPSAHGNFLTKASALMEVLDPGGHRYEVCFENYYVRYHRQEPFSGRHFFDWLDFGTGKRLLDAKREREFMPYMEHDETCGKKHFDARKVHYFDDKRRARNEVYFAPSGNGKEVIARYKYNDAPVPPGDKEPHLYMLDLEEKFYVVDNKWHKKYGMPKHTSVLAGRPALCAGTAYFGENGTVWEINFDSGHYRPGVRSASILYQWMKDRGFNTTALRWVGRNKWSMNDYCGRNDWEGMKIKGYNATALNASCHEMIVSPTWVLKDDE